MYLWQKSATPRWLDANEELQANANLVVIEPAGRKNLQLEVCCRSATQARQFVDEFGGRIEKLPRDWLKRFLREREKEPFRVAKRLVVLRARSRSGGFPAPNAFGAGKPPFLLIPAGMAFGTGDHATTAMSLRLLEEVSRTMKSGWSFVDLGTGSGILALAAKRFGARRVIAIDNDPRAIATARANARMNRIERVDFREADVREWRFPREIDIVAANLFSELLIEILPKLTRALKRDGRMTFSGVLRNQERELRRALLSHKIDIVEVRRRGKWVALIAQKRI